MPKNKKKKRKEFSISFGRVSLVDKALFAKHLSVMLKSGIPLTEALDIAGDSANKRLKKVLEKVSKSVKSGRKLADSLELFPKEFSGLFINSIKAGEASGTLVENLENVAIELEKENKLRGKIKAAMIYPVVVLTATFILGLVLAFVVLPKITPLFQGLRVDLPITTRWLISISGYIQDHGLILFSAIILITFFFIWLLKTKLMQPFTHAFLLKFPIIKDITKNANLARFSRTLAMLLKSGVRIDEGLDITKDSTSNYYYQKSLRRINKDIRKGTKLSDNLAVDQDLFPVLLTKMVQVGEESGNFEETLFYLADFYEERVDSATKALSTAVEPILLLVIGLVVGFLALSIITPIYDITGNIQR